MNRRRLAKRKKRKARRDVRAACGRLTGEIRGIAAMAAMLTDNVEPPPPSKPKEEYPLRVVSIGAERFWNAELVSNSPRRIAGNISPWMHKRVGKDRRRDLWLGRDAVITLRRKGINPDTGGPCAVKTVQRPPIVRGANTHSPTFEPQPDLVTYIGNKSQGPKPQRKRGSKKGAAVAYKSNSAADDRVLAAVLEQERRVNVARMINLA